MRTYIHTSTHMRVRACVCGSMRPIENWVQKKSEYKKDRGEKRGIHNSFIDIVSLFVTIEYKASSYIVVCLYYFIRIMECVVSLLVLAADVLY